MHALMRAVTQPTKGLEMHTEAYTIILIKTTYATLRVLAASPEEAEKLFRDGRYNKNEIKPMSAKHDEPEWEFEDARPAAPMADDQPDFTE